MCLENSKIRLAFSVLFPPLNFSNKTTRFKYPLFRKGPSVVEFHTETGQLFEILAFDCIDLEFGEVSPSHP